MLNNRAEFIVYRQNAEKDYAAQEKKIIVCAGTRSVSSPCAFVCFKRTMML